MKNIFKIVLSASIVLGLWSCKKDEHKVIFKGGTAPVVQTSVTGEIPMSFATQNATAFSLNWTNPEYQFNTGVNSQDVNYNILIDKTASFNNPDLKTVSVGTDLSKTFTQAEFNDILLNQLLLSTGISQAVYVRVDAFFVGGSELLSSNTLTLMATPYVIPPKVAPPTSGQLFITGSATPKGWMGGGDAPVLSQQFTKISNTVYQITVNLIGGQSYTFVPVYGNWDNKYSIAVKNDPNEVSGGDFMVGGNDILAPAANGTYKITVDFQRGKFIVTPA